MITKEEFLDIVENHLFSSEDGAIIIRDKDLAKKFADYLTQFTSKTEPIKIAGGSPVTPDEAWVEVNWNCQRKKS